MFVHILYMHMMCMHVLNACNACEYVLCTNVVCVVRSCCVLYVLCVLSILCMLRSLLSKILCYVN